MSDVQTVSLTDFLLARIAEQEAAIRAGGHGWIEVEQYIIRASDGPIVFTEERALARCAADRLIVALYRGRTGANYSQRRGEHDTAKAAIRALASVYADHPEFRQEWA